MENRTIIDVYLRDLAESAKQSPANKASEIEEIRRILAQNDISLYGIIEALNFSIYEALLPLTLHAVKKEKPQLTKTKQEDEAKLNALKLALIFNDYSKAIKYLKNYEGRTSKTNTKIVKGACSFSLPKAQGHAKWPITAWQKVIKNLTPTSPEDLILRLLPKAGEIEHKNIKLTPNMLPNKLLELSKEVLFANAEKNSAAAAVFFTQAMEERYFDEYLSLKPQDDNNAIPNIIIDGNNFRRIAAGEENYSPYPGYTLRKLSPFDPRAAVLGKFTSCCQLLGKEGASSAIHGITDPQGGFYVLFKNNGNNKPETIVAQCWAWRSKDQIMFDSVESQVDMRKTPSQLQLISDFYTALASILVKDHGISRVLVGYGVYCQTPKNVGIFVPQELLKPQDKTLYSDSSEKQLAIADAELPLLNFYCKFNPENRLGNLALSGLRQDSKILKKIAKSYDLKSTLYQATSVNRLDLVKELIEINQQLPKEYQFCSVDVLKEATITAAKSGAIDAMKWFIQEKNVDVTIQDDFGKTLLHAGAYSGKTEILKWLIEEANLANYIYTTNNRGETILHLAVAAGNLDTVKWLVEVKKMDINALNADGENILACAVQLDNDKIDMVKWLVEEKHMDVNYVNFNNDTLLHKALQNEKTADIVEYLVEHGANTNVKNDEENSLLHIAAGEIDKLREVTYLVELNLDVNAENESGETPLHCAVTRGSLEVVQYLVQNGANIHAKTTDDKDVLYHAVINGKKLDIIRWLLENGAAAEINSELDDGSTILYHCVKSKVNVLILELLLKHGADINAQNKHGYTALHCAVQNNNPALVKCLTEHGANINIANVYGDTPFLMAVKDNNLALLKLLFEIKKDLNVNERDEEGNTALHYAVMRDDFVLVKLLIERGINIQDKNNEGKTVFDLFSYETSGKIIQFLNEQNKKLSSFAELPVTLFNSSHSAINQSQEKETHENPYRNDRG